LARFLTSLALAAADNFLFGVVFVFPPFCSAWNATHRLMESHEATGKIVITV
jgi:hypothetical protein